jgi:hypothetical protein
LPNPELHPVMTTVFFMQESLRSEYLGGQWLKRQYIVISAEVEGLGAIGRPAFGILGG